MTTMFVSENFGERDHLEALDIDGRIVLNCMLNRMKGCGLDSVGSEHSRVVVINLCWLSWLEGLGACLSLLRHKFDPGQLMWDLW